MYITEDGTEYCKKCGTRRQVLDGVVFCTSGGLRKEDLEERGSKIISKKRSRLGKERYAVNNPFKKAVSVAASEPVSEQSSAPRSPEPQRKTTRRRRARRSEAPKLSRREVRV